MSDISSVQLQKHRDAELSRQKTELKVAQDESKKQIKKELDYQEGVIVELKKDHQKKSDHLQMDLEYKLIELRKKHDEMYASEKNRLEKEMEMLKKAHEDRVTEIKISHQNEIQQIDESHQNTLYNARQKFMKEKMKWNA